MKIIQEENTFLIQQRYNKPLSQAIAVIVAPLVLCLFWFIVQMVIDKPESAAPNSSNNWVRFVFALLIFNSPFILIGLILMSKSPIEEKVIFNKATNSFSIQSRTIFRTKKNDGDLTQIKKVQVSESILEGRGILFGIDLVLLKNFSSTHPMRKPLFSTYESDSGNFLKLATQVSKFLKLPDPEIVTPGTLDNAEAWFEEVVEDVDKTFRGTNGSVSSNPKNR